MFQLPVSPGSYSDHSNHAMSLAGMGHYRGHDNLPISDNNVSTTNDALDTGDWELPGEEADIDVSFLEKGGDSSCNQMPFADSCCCRHRCRR